MGPKDIRAIHVGPDPDEDYAEARLPFPLCLVTIEAGRRKLRLVASAGDAARLREWAERKGIAVVDPQGLSTRPVGSEPAVDQAPGPRVTHCKSDRRCANVMVRPPVTRARHDPTRTG